MEQKQHGGKREGAGRRKILSAPLPTQSIRCTKEELKQLKEYLNLIRKK